MSNRSFSWTVTLADLHVDRVKLAPGVLSAQSLVAAYARLRGVRLVVAGRVDRAALMRLAIGAARAHRHRTGDTWAASLSVALRGAWIAVRAAGPVVAPAAAAARPAARPASVPARLPHGDRVSASATRRIALGASLASLMSAPPSASILATAATVAQGRAVATVPRISLDVAATASAVAARTCPDRRGIGPPAA